MHIRRYGEGYMTYKWVFWPFIDWPHKYHSTLEAARKTVENHKTDDELVD